MNERPTPDSTPPREHPPGLRGFKITSGRRTRDLGWMWTLVAVAAFTLVSIAIVRFRAETERQPPPVRRTRVVPPPTAAPPVQPTSTPTPSPAPAFVEVETEVSLPSRASPTPTPWVPEPSLSPTPRARPADSRRRSRLPDCLSVSWTYGQASLRPPQVLIDIAARNGCGRDLAASEVWFRVIGWRNGDLIQTATGHLFTPLYSGSIGYTGIGLPGSADWYDRITLEVLEGPP